MSFHLGFGLIHQHPAGNEVVDLKQGLGQLDGKLGAATKRNEEYVTVKLVGLIGTKA